MRPLVTLLVLASLTACAQKKSAPATTGSADKPAPVAQPTEVGSAAPSGSASPTPPPATDASAEVADLVVHSVGSKALGSQKIDASCVTVVLMPSGSWTVASAWLKNCGDKTARSILWLYKRSGSAGKWNEDYVGQPPKCWKGVPPDIAEAVTKATKIPGC